LNVQLARTVLKALLESGVEECVICGGNRNAPLIAVFHSQPDLRIYHHLSEQAGAFFALGRVKITNKPVAIIVTSGTAAAELLPACIEAYYSLLPLILVTADRPKAYRGTGAPQSIEQKGIFSSYVSECIDLSNDSNVEEFSVHPAHSPLHINVCFDEPLIDGDFLEPVVVNREAHTPNLAPRLAISQLADFLRTAQAPLCIVSRLSDQQREPVLTFLKQLGAPIIAESLSGLREETSLSEQILRSGEKLVKSFPFDSVIRIGSVPVTSLWRDLERDPVWSRLPVLSLASKARFSGLARQSLTLDLDETEFAMSGLTLQTDYQSLIEADRRLWTATGALFAQYPRAEQTFFHEISKLTERDAVVYLGNSLPIRFWDSFSQFEPNRRQIDANRGANGIDGQLSTFLGMCTKCRTNWAILGDLTALYDCVAPSVLSQIDASIGFNLVIVNNFGGRIFEALPGFEENFQGKPAADAFIQPHDFEFEHFAKMWRMSYQLCANITDYSASTHNQRQLIELRPCPQQTREFAKALRRVS
jgi:2-succinyl-5-enolpyruvyl-6-hydroxy-3-cyclohexene-1-carboxylate synthase